MRKPLFLLTSLVIIGGSAYALFPGLFPDTPSFPRVPTGDGTVGSILTKILGTSDLANYNGDGTVANSLTLSGRTESGYLRDDPVCPAGQKYIGIKPNGRRDCASTTTLLADYGRIDMQGCDADYYRADGTTGKTSTGDMLKAGDIVKTAPGCPLDIVFADFSILRLDGDTTVSFDLGTLSSGMTIASAILANGSLWGRILTETGSYSIGTSTIVAGVRGTSISIVSTGNTLSSTFAYDTGIHKWNLGWVPSISPQYIDVIDTLDPTKVTMECRTISQGGNTIVTPYNTITPLTRESSYSLPATGCMTTPSVSTALAAVSYSRPWVRESTARDIVYLYRALALSGTALSSTKQARIQSELNITKPANTAESNALCPSGQRWWDERHGCQPIGVLAIADYTLPDIAGSVITPALSYLSGGSLVSVPEVSTSTTITPGQGVSITSTGVIKYYSNISTSPLARMQQAIGGFSGKTIEITTDTLTNGSQDKCILQITSNPSNEISMDTVQTVSYTNMTSLASSIANTYKAKINNEPGSSWGIYIGNNANTTTPIGTFVRQIKILQ